MAELNQNILFAARPADMMRVAERDAALESVRLSNAMKMGEIGNNLLNQQSVMRENEQEKIKAQAKDMASDAIRLRPLIEAGDMKRANVLMAERIAKIQQRGGDPSETMAFRDALNMGQLDQAGALQELDGVIDAGTRLGLIEPVNGLSGARAFAPVPTQDAAGNFTGYAIPTIDAAGQTSLKPIAGSDAAISPIDLAAARENIGVQGYGQRRQIEAQTAPVIAGGERRAQLDVESEIRPQLEASVEGAKATARQDAERKGGILKAISEEQEVGRILDMAQPLLAETTESLAGVAVDAAGKLVGLSNKGARAAAQLKTLEGALVLKMPRMEGPQSNADRDLYVQMAAQIGDATVPAEIRSSAVEILRALNARYSEKKSPDKLSPPPPGLTSISDADLMKALEGP